MHVMPSFDHDDPKYKCGSGCCKAVTAAVVIGVLEVFGAVALLVKVSWNSEDIKGLGMIVLCIYIVINALTLLAAIAMFVGIYRNKASLIMPHMLIQVICMVCLVIIIILVSLSYVILRNKPDDDRGDSEVSIKDEIIFDDRRRIEAVNLTNNNNELQTIMMAVLATCGATFLFEIWIFMVVLACYRYLRDRSLFDNCPMRVPFA